MRRNSGSSITMMYAYDMGYRVINNEVLSPHGIIRKTSENSYGYKRFTIKNPENKKALPVLVHQLLAYELFGDDIFNHDCIRHLDGDKSNNLPENLKLGTHSENSLDRPRDMRILHAKHASSKNIREDWGSIERDRFDNGFSYKQLSEKYGVSKGTLSYHFNKI